LDPFWGFTLVLGIHDPRISWLLFGTKNHEFPVVVISLDNMTEHFIVCNQKSAAFLFNFKRFFSFVVALTSEVNMGLATYRLPGPLWIVSPNIWFLYKTGTVDCGRVNEQTSDVEPQEFFARFTGISIFCHHW
jgi:hypothetical protein